jgi:hypothetical protein
MSLDYKLMFGSHLAIMIMFMVGSALTLPVEGAIEVALLTSIGLVLAWRRSVDGWRWAGAGPRQLLNALSMAAVVVVFLGSALLASPPNSQQMLPWYLAGGNIGLFLVLMSLRVVRPSRSLYEKDCGEPDGETAPPAEPTTDDARRGVIVAIYRTVFFLVWLNCIAVFFMEGAAAPSPESLRLAPFLAPIAKNAVALQTPVIHQAMEIGMFAGIPCVLFGGFLLQYVLGVPVFPGLPARRLFSHDRE